MSASDAQVRPREVRQERTAIRRIAAASLIGTLIEWYDFFLYAAMAALVFNHVFFPALNDAAGTLASFATFGAAFVARPIGSVVMGHFGDRHGRKIAMVTSLVTMGSATVAIITTCGLLADAMAGGGYSPLQVALLTVAIGFGSLGLSHVNDSGFWIVTRYLGLSVGDGLRTWTVLTTVLGLAGFALTALLWVAVA